MVLRRALNGPTLAAGGLLLAALIGSWGVVLSRGAHLIKKPLVLREPLYRIGDRVGSYQRIRDETFSREIVEELGTEQYILWTFQDTHDPDVHIRLHVAYHSGEPDAVPRVLERSYAAGGVEPVGGEARTIELDESQLIFSGDGRVLGTTAGGGTVALPGRSIPLTMFRHRAFDGAESVVGYFFVANGRVYRESGEVRRAVFDWRASAAYWCRVEVQVLGVSEMAGAAEQVRRFLSVAMAPIAACLPEYSTAEVAEGREQAGRRSGGK